MHQSVLMIIMGVLGILFYNLVKARGYIADKTFSIAIFIKENIQQWLWAMAMLLITSVMLFIEPKANELIKTFAGFDLDNTTIGWAVYGIFLVGSIRSVKSK